MKARTRFFALVLTMCMVLNMIPFGVFAEDADASAATETVEETVAATEAPTEAPEETTAPTEATEAPTESVEEPEEDYQIESLADIEETTEPTEVVNIELYVGQSFVVDDPTGNYENQVVTEPDAKVTMTVSGDDTTKKIEEVTSTDSLVSGSSFLLENVRAGL